jgi:hypothetical protein
VLDSGSDVGDVAGLRPAPSFEAVQALVSTVQSAQHRAVG